MQLLRKIEARGSINGQIRTRMAYARVLGVRSRAAGGEGNVRYGHTCRTLVAGEARDEGPAEGGAARAVVAAASGRKPERSKRRPLPF